MKVIHAKTTRNRRIRAMPVTGNYLVRGSDGMYRWAEPNERWRLFSPTGGSKCIMSNIRRDDTDHSPDLWLYSNLTQRELSRLSTETDFGNELMESNSVTLDRTRKWYVRQFIEMERVGIKRFTGLPLSTFWDVWRTTIQTTDIEIYGLSNGQMKIKYSGFNFNVYLNWPELQLDIRQSRSSIVHDNIKWTISERVLPWLHHYCEKGFVPFSDYDVMFEDAEDEFAYLADVA